MKIILIALLVVCLQAEARSCTEFLFSHVIYGWNADIRLDSANWDIQSEGGDRNHYLYSADGRISKNIRITGSSTDTIVFNKISPDSLTWMHESSLNVNWIKFTPNGYYSKWYDYQTMNIDTLKNMGDTIVVSEYSKYSTESPVIFTRIWNNNIVGYNYKYVREAEDVFDSSEAQCIETVTSITFKSADPAEFHITINVDGNQRSDTLWQSLEPTQSWHYTLSSSTKTIKKSKEIKSIRPSKKFDILGRKK